MTLEVDISKTKQKCQKQKHKEVLTNQRNAKDNITVDKKIHIKKKRNQG